MPISTSMPIPAAGSIGLLHQYVGNTEAPTQTTAEQKHWQNDDNFVSPCQKIITSHLTLSANMNTHTPHHVETVNLWDSTRSASKVNEDRHNTTHKEGVCYRSKSDIYPRASDLIDVMIDNTFQRT